jgi:hypothetical protein
MRSREAHFRLTPKRIAIAIVVLALVGGGWLLGSRFGSDESRTARARVTELFGALENQGAAELALTRWYGGPLPTDPDLAAMLSDEFRGFCAQHKLRPMRRFEIREARETGEKDRLGAAVVVVSGVANGEPFRLRVQRGRTITWAE